MAHILREIGWDAQTLPGGYKAYRKWVVQQLEQTPQQLHFQVVHGPTGSGKSRLLAALAGAGGQVLDLERLAAHRGSVLGGLPNRPQPSQKMFESLLLREMTGLEKDKVVYIEGESKKIGQLQVPESLIARMRASPCVRLETDTETRVTLLLQEYEFFLNNPENLYQQLDCLVSLHGREKVAGWKALGERGAWREFVARLLAEHYDPAYRRSSHKNFVHLPDARAVRIATADEAAFARAAQSLVASSELQPA